MKYLALFLAAALLASCSAPKEEIRTEKPEVKSVDITPPVPTRVFQFEDRYYVKGAAIDKSSNIDDPMQALRVIQIKEGPNDVLVISSFEKIQENGKPMPSETWFGVELPSMAPGVYDLAKAGTVSFYRFYLGDKPRRLDGQKFTGTLTIEEAKDGAIIGSLMTTISGVSKSFELPTEPFTTDFFGSFKIKEVPLEATIMKSRK